MAFPEHRVVVVPQTEVQCQAGVDLPVVLHVPRGDDIRGVQLARPTKRDPLEKPTISAEYVDAVAAIDALERRRQYLGAELDEMLLRAPAPALQAGQAQFQLVALAVELVEVVLAQTVLGELRGSAALGPHGHIEPPQCELGLPERVWTGGDLVGNGHVSAPAVGVRCGQRRVERVDPHAVDLCGKHRQRAREGVVVVELDVHLCERVESLDDLLVLAGEIGLHLRSHEPVGERL